MRIVVTGATGNLGTAVLRSLGADPAVEEIVGVARRRPDVRPPKVVWHPADVAVDDLRGVLAGADAVFHLAWLIQPSRDEAATFAVNVTGTQAVLDAAAGAGVGTVLVASSVGAYSAGPKDRRVDETWATQGTPSSFYARHKAEVERRLDAFEGRHPDVRVVRMRPGLIFQQAAGSEIRRLFIGPLLPHPLVRRDLIAVVPRVRRLVFQAVHADDVAEAFRVALHETTACGAYNLAADPVIDADELGRLLDARPVPVPAALLRGLASATWKLRLQPTPPGWLDMALAVPIMDTTRARSELGWKPEHSAGDAVLELLEGLGDGAGHPTPPLDRRAGGLVRWREFAQGVGGRN